MNKDIFCKMIKGEIPTQKIMETDNWFAINDIHPNAKTHALIISKKHGSLIELESDENHLGSMIHGAVETAKKIGLDKTGFRLIVNTGEDAQGHILDHLHIHILGGQKLGSNLVKED